MGSAADAAPRGQEKMVSGKVIVRVNRSGNRSNDRAERSLRTIAPRPGPNRSIVGGEGLSSSLRSRSAGSANECLVKQQLTLVVRSFVRVIVRVIVRDVSSFIGWVCVSCCFCEAKVIVRFDRSDTPLEETNDYRRGGRFTAWLLPG